MSETSSKRHLEKLPARLVSVSILLATLGFLLAVPAGVRPATGAHATVSWGDGVTVSWGDRVTVSWGDQVAVSWGDQVAVT